MRWGGAIYHCSAGLSAVGAAPHSPPLAAQSAPPSAGPSHEVAPTAGAVVAAAPANAEVGPPETSQSLLPAKPESIAVAPTSSTPVKY